MSCQIIPKEVTDVLEFATGEWAMKNLDKVNFKEALDPDNILQYIRIEFPSDEHEEFKNKLMIYGDYVSKDKFGPSAYVFSEIPELYFDSNTCATIYKFLKSHIQKNEIILIKLEYDNVPSNARKYTIDYNHMIKKDS